MVDFANPIPTRQAIKDRVVNIAKGIEAAADGTFLSPILRITDWTPGGNSERWIEMLARVIDAFLSSITLQAVRGFFLDLATDPGDPGDLATDQTPRPGWLSALGAGWYGVLRGPAIYAPGFVTITNAGASTTLPMKPGLLHFKRSTPGPDGGFPTYVGTADASIYTSLGGTLILAPGQSATVPVIADQIGSYATATTGTITVSTNQSFGTLTVTNASPVVGSDREDADLYRTRCRLASAAASPNGPADAYRYAATTGADGLPLQLGDGSGVTTVNRVYVSADSTQGTVTIYLANPSGPATAVEVTSANGNINRIPIVNLDGVIYNPYPIGVVPDTVAIGPTVADAITGAPGPAAATATVIGPMKGGVRIKAVPGLSPNALVSAVQTSMEAGFAEFFASPVTAPIGGVDQVAGAGVIYTSDLTDIVKDAHEGLYAAALTTPGTTSTAIILGHVPQYKGPPTVVSAANNGGEVRLTISDTTGLANTDIVQIYDAVTTGGLVLNGLWVIHNLAAGAPGTIDLSGSTWTGAMTSASLSLVRVTVV